MKASSKGKGNRYADDLGGNHLDRVRQQATGLGFFKDFKNRICTACGKRKPAKGGTGIGKRFVCVDCKPKTPNSNSA